MPNNSTISDTVYLASYSGSNLDYFAETVMDTDSTIQFVSRKPLPSGMYSVVAKNGSTIFDFLISHSQPQTFTVIVDSSDSQYPVLFIGSDENNAFNKYLVDENSISDYSNFPMLSFLAKSLTSVNDSMDLKIHYFDNIDFTDVRTAKIPVLEGKLYDYFFHVLNVLDTVELKAGVDDILERALSQPEVYKICATFLYDIFVNSPLPDHETVAEYIADNYIFAGFTYLFNTDFIERIKNETNWINRNPVGSIAVDMNLQDIAGNYIRLSDLNSKFSILLFLDPDCVVCREVVPLVYELYKSYKRDELTVYAVYPGYDEKAWKSYILNNKYDWVNVWSNGEPEVIYKNYSLIGIPTIYLLDSEKRILAKDISIDELVEILSESLD